MDFIATDSDENLLELDVVVVGGGFAGVFTARELAKQMPAERRKQIGIVSEQNYFVFQPMLPEVAGGSVSPRHVINPIRFMCRGIEVIRGDVEKIDWQARELNVNSGSFSPCIRIRYQHLVLALGAEIDLSRVPGMSEHALLMQNVGDAMKLRATVIGRFEEANVLHNPELRRRLLTFVVVGGGYSGVETAGQILDMFHGIHGYYSRIDADDFKVILVHSQPHILPTLNEKLGEYAAGVLRKRGLEIILNRRVKSVTAHSVYLDDGSVISTATVVSTVGNAPHRKVVGLAKEAGLDLERGRIITDENLRVKGVDGLWAAGDCASVPMQGGGSCPPTAQFAMRQGMLLGRNIAAALLGGKLKPFRFKGMGELATIGHRVAVAEVFGLRFHGFFAWWLWRSVYLAKLPGIERKIRIMLDWTMDLFFPRDINLLNPRYTTLIREMYLEKGDVLFRPGEPAFSLYIVKEGCMEVRDKKNLLKEVSSGDYFGERALLEDRIWHYSAVAKETTRLIALSAEAFIPIVQGSTSLRNLFRRSAGQYRSESEVTRIASSIPPELKVRKVSELMQREPAVLSMNATLGQALVLMRSRHFSSYPVLNTEGGAVGVLRRNDFYDYLKTPGINLETPLREMPLGHLASIQSSATIGELLEKLVRAGTNKLLVEDEAGKLVGIVTLMDLLGGWAGGQ